MKLKTQLAAVLGALALAAVPSAALATQPENPGGNGRDHAQGHGPEYTPPEYTPPENTPGPKATLPAKAKAYGVYCRGQSRKHVRGEKGTPFSQCVTAMARAANHENMNPRRACRQMSRKHVKGEKGTPFSRCVVSAAKLQRQAPEGGEGSEG